MKRTVSSFADRRVLRNVPALAGNMIVLVFVLLACSLDVRVWAQSAGENTDLKKTLKQTPVKLDRYVLNLT